MKDTGGDATRQAPKAIRREVIGDCTLLIGNALAVLRDLPSCSVNCIVTSPPYFGLRSYLPDDHPDKAAEIGLEPTPDEFVARLVEVFRECRRVLRDDGVCFVNLGDSYARAGGTDRKVSASAQVGSTRNTLAQMGDRTCAVSNIADFLARSLKGGVLLFGRAHARCGAAESVHVLIDDQSSPDGVFEPLFRAHRIVVKQGQHDFCEIGNAFDAPVTCWARRPIGFAEPADANAERRINFVENTNIIVTAGDLHTDAALRVSAARAVKNGKATFAIEVPGEPEAEGVAASIPVWDAVTLDASFVCRAEIDAVDQPVALLDGSMPSARGGCDFRVRKATDEHVSFGLVGGGQLCFVRVGHLSLVNGGCVTPYATLLENATKKANASRSKQELGIPEMAKRALMEDGWICRQTIIWSKPNPMPESVRDRCTKAHEYVFLLTKSERYWWDAAAIAERFATSASENYPARAQVTGRGMQGGAAARGNDRDKSGGFPPSRETRNRRSIWTVATEPYAGAHFATMPTKLVEPCILAGCPLGGVVLDPFGGSGTVGAVASYHGRRSILIDLDERNEAMIRERLERHETPLFAEPAPRPTQDNLI